MAYKTCENCGSRIFEYGCVNCNETDYITMQEEYVKPLKTKQTMTELLPGIIGIEVEATGDDIEVIRDQDNYDQQQLKFPSDKYHGLQNYSWVNLPAGSWKYLFLSFNPAVNPMIPNNFLYIFVGTGLVNHFKFFSVVKPYLHHTDKSSVYSCYSYFLFHNHNCFKIAKFLFSSPCD